MIKLRYYIIPSLAFAIGLTMLGYFLDGYFQSIALATASVSLGLSVGLVVVNGFVNEKERRLAAMVLMQMVANDVNDYNTLFISKGRERFGIPVWNEIIDVMNRNRRNPVALTPEQRAGVLEIIEGNAEEIRSVMQRIDSGFREMSYVLGWNFHPKILRDTMLSRMEISEFLSHLGTSKNCPDVAAGVA